MSARTVPGITVRLIGVIIVLPNVDLQQFIISFVC